MPSQDTLLLQRTAVPTAAAGAIAAVVSAFVAGGKGALGAVVATVIVLLFMGGGLALLQWVGRTYPQIFQGMGLALYTGQLLLLFVFVAAFKNTDLFDPKVFAAVIVAGTLIWVAAQARAHTKAKILYVDPEAANKAGNGTKTGSRA
ncbi:hypothetical protein [Streptomyces sp. SID11385]|uniref:hypothetical protein n=1 Tax=Streptomyces sp. SID11385 TaxID=2706031 RepID=UPI0013C61C5E|nr:hypothetical protein [Streptomyces sp. SID11385]NEA38908.1 hypothetical protein [Streptomyces sp. SID11385]